MAEKNEQIGERPEDYGDHGIGAHQTAGHGIAHDEDQAAGSRPLPAPQRAPDNEGRHRPKSGSPETQISIGQQG